VRKKRVKRVTLADVAALAGVSVATASVAITGRPSGNCRVSPAVAEKIRRAAKELHYRPNLQARSLSTQRTRTIAMLIKRSSWHNAMYYVGAAQRVLRSRGYSETILALPLIDPDGKANVEMYNRLHTEEKIPVVQLALALPGCVAPSVSIDVIKGVAKTVTLLHAMGHRRIAMATLAGYDDATELTPHFFAQQVYRGYRQGMAELNLSEQLFRRGAAARIGGRKRLAAADGDRLVFLVRRRRIDGRAERARRSRARRRFGDFLRRTAVRQDAAPVPVDLGRPV